MNAALQHADKLMRNTKMSDHLLITCYYTKKQGPDSINVFEET